MFVYCLLKGLFTIMFYSISIQVHTKFSSKKKYPNEKISYKHNKCFTKNMFDCEYISFIEESIM